MNKVKSIIENLTADEQDGIIRTFKAGFPIVLNGYDNELPIDCFNLKLYEKENISRSENGFLVAINTEITSALKAEGMYREILRHCQLLRKEAGFAVSDRVCLFFKTESDEIKEVLEIYKKDIMRETLSDIKEIQTPVMHREVCLYDEKVIIFVC